ncbi:MAG: hypothetical protein J6L83_08280 [Clostridia bacterium]|nr:hypothetical protein [Clostridia bacterium]
MKKFSFAKIVSFVMVCAMLMGALAIGVFATEGVVVAILSNNVYYGEKFEIMYAIKAPEGAVIEAVDSEGNEIRVLPFTDEDGKTTANIDGVDYPMYILEDGVAAQAIDEVITITVTAGENVATQEYSVLEYIYERMYVKADVEGAELDMFNALLAYANAADIALNGASAEESLGNLVYVSAVDCAFDGATSGVVAAGTVLYFETDLVANDGYVLSYYVTDLDSDTVVAKIDAETMANEGYTVTGKVSVQAIVEESNENKEVIKLATFEMGDATTDGSNAITTYTETVDGYTLNIINGAKMYKGFGNGDSALKFGSSSGKGSCTVSVDADITKVVLYVSSYGTDSKVILVAGKEYTLSNEYAAIEIVQPTEGIEWTIEVAAKNASNNRFYIGTIEFWGYSE